ncbi:MAG: ABC transporter permease [Gemmatimonadales bacterium]
MRPSWTGRAFRLPWREPAEIDADLDEELRYHLDQRTAELMTAGLSAEAARQEALRRFGDLDGARDYCRSLDRGRARLDRRRDWLTGWRQDLAFAARQLIRNPGFTFIAVLTLALGVGANTAIFSVVHRLLLDPLPYADGDRMVALMESGAKAQIQMSPRAEVVEAWRSRSRTVEALDQFSEEEVTLTDGGTSETMVAGRITPTLPAFLGVSPALGRGFLPEESRAGGPSVAMLSHGIWQRRYGGDPGVLGRPITLNGRSFTIVGVLPRDFTLPFMGGGAGRQLWLPLVPSRDDERMQAIGRLRRGATAAEATTELTTIMASMPGLEPGRTEFAARAIPPAELMSGGVRDTLLLLFGVVGVVLLIACANVANLLLARASTRHRELAIRAALGAGRARLIRQLLTESVGLALLGGMGGVLLAWRGLDLLIALRPESLSELDDVRLMPIALAWSFGLSLLTGLIFGLAPAFFATDRNLSGALKSTAGGAGGHRGSRRLRAALVMTEVALSVTLLVGAGLLIRTVVRMQRAELGFAPHDLGVVSLSQVAGVKLKAAERDAIQRTLLEQIRALPGVESAALTDAVPPRGGAAFGELEIEGRTLGADEQASILRMTSVAPEFFAVMQQPVTQGTSFTADTSGNPMIINATMARRYWPGTSAVGRHFRMSAESPWLTVVGVAGDVRIPGPRGAIDDLQLYYPYSSVYGLGEVVVRTRGDQTAVFRGIQRTVDGVSPQIRLSKIESVDARMIEVIAGPRFSMALFAAFAALALILASIGLYGVISYSVGQRTREIGVRIALGAAAPSVIRLVVGQGLRLTFAGVLLGLLAAAAGTRAMASMLFEVDPLDPLTFMAVALILVLVAALASWLPARRATRVDPVVALRSE